MDNSNRLVNSAGYYLMATTVGGTTPSDFVVDTDDIAAVPASVVDYTLNLPSSALIRSEEHTSELQSLMRISYAVFCLKKNTITIPKNSNVSETTSHIQTTES